MKLIISGAREYDPGLDTFIRNTTNALGNDFDRKVTEFVLGDNPRGVDKMAFEMVRAIGAPYSRFEAFWDTEGRGAGHKRNGRMVAAGDALLAFWGGRKLIDENCGDGTLNCIRKALHKRIPVTIFDYASNKVRRYHGEDINSFLELERRSRFSTTVTFS